MLAAQLRTARRTGRAMHDDVTVYQQAAMPEQLLVPFPDADPEAESDRLDDEPKPMLDLTAVRALQKSRTDEEALGHTVEQMCHLTDSVTEMVDRGRALR
ncbi:MULTISPECIES: hypothetical protein [unclassified Streptomyces]|uniref:hypothetical protein n=1 Tax=unclassified Streptomyces TaxID=2593676 RepID=UPI0004BDA941|nr:MULTISPECIES: hypothetical protein [unclassified Streptomyces]